MIFAVPKPRKRPKAKPRGLTRSPMRRRANQVPRDTDRMVFVRAYPCVICTHTGRKQRSKSEADHIRTRGAGGKEAGNLWPLCRAHHDERHRRGLRGFAYEYGVQPEVWGAWYEREYVGRP